MQLAPAAQARNTTHQGSRAAAASGPPKKTRMAATAPAP